MKRPAGYKPQRAVTELQGNYQVAVVEGNNRVRIATVKPGEEMHQRIHVSPGPAKIFDIQMQVGGIGF